MDVNRNEYLEILKKYRENCYKFIDKLFASSYNKYRTGYAIDGLEGLKCSRCL